MQHMGNPAEGPLPLKKWRERRGLTQFDLAVKSGVGLSTIAGIENMRTVPRIDTVLSLSRTLGVAVEQVIWPTSDTVQLPQSKQLRTFPANVQIEQAATVFRIVNEGYDTETELAALAQRLTTTGWDAEMVTAAVTRARAVVEGEQRKKTVA